MDYYLLIAIISIILFLSLTIVGIAFATNEEDEDKVGEILEDQGIERNPPEVNQSKEVGSASGQISSFDEGPIVISP